MMVSESFFHEKKAMWNSDHIYSILMSIYLYPLADEVM